VDVEGWLTTREVLARQGSSLVVFVPFPPDRWPERLRGNLSLVQWDRVTKPSTVVQSLRTGRR
jgi:hypothetical protein